MSHASPNRLEEDDEPEEDIINAAGLDEADAHALARHFGLDATLPAQALALSAPVHALVLDTATGSGWELSLLCYGTPDGWGGLTVYAPADTPAGLTRAAAWLLARLA